MAVTAAEAARHLRSRAAERARVAAQRAARLMGLVPLAAELLRNRYGAREVVLFGSLATGSFTELSDVDLAVRGIDAADYFAALADLMALFGGPVDLVRLEQAPASLGDRIAAEGRPAKIAADDTA
jgi:predicted nucleotidyltransferase